MTRNLSPERLRHFATTTRERGCQPFGYPLMVRTGLLIKLLGEASLMIA